MKFINIAVKGIKEIIRDKKNLGLLLLFPAVFMLVFGFAFGANIEGDVSYDIAIINNDRGVLFSNETQEYIDFGNDFADALGELTYNDIDNNVFHLHFISKEEADSKIVNREISCIVTISEDFSEKMYSYLWLDEQSPTITIEGETGYLDYEIVNGLLSGIMGEYNGAVAGYLKPKILDPRYTEDINFDSFVASEELTKPDSPDTETTFDTQAPGIIVFALLLLIITVAASLAEEAEKGTLNRLKISKMKGYDLLIGTMIPWTVIAIIQVIILFLVAIGIGYNWAGGMDSIGLAIMLGIFGGIASVSFGLIIAAFSKTEKHASNLGMLISIPISFIVGAFFPLPRTVIGEFGGRLFEVYDILPWTHTANGLRSVLTFGNGLGDITYDIAMMLFLTIIIFMIGIICFSKLRLKAEK
ncbi:MAG: ABC transporter permease [Thermoplasmatales archaeon]|nr:MAG: ABC transporter permease [Thermoplasmatales archaeon]